MLFAVLICFVNAGLILPYWATIDRSRLFADSEEIVQDKIYAVKFAENNLLGMKLTKKFEKDTFVKGKMSAKLTVSSDCEDTCLYMRISIEKERGNLGLRDDITSVCYQLGDYVKNTEHELSFNFDEIAFLIKKGERLRVDISSADAAHYVRHTNNKGLFSEQTTARIAHNTVDLSKSVLKIPVENQMSE